MESSRGPRRQKIMTTTNAFASDLSHGPNLPIFLLAPTVCNVLKQVQVDYVNFLLSPGWFTLNNIEYFVSVAATNLEEALGNCGDLHAKILSITSEQEQLFIEDILQKFVNGRIH